MARKIQIDNNWVEITHATSGTVLFESAIKDIKYRRGDSGVATIYADNNTGEENSVVWAYDGFVDSGDAPIADIYDWLRTNTGYITDAASSAAVALNTTHRTSDGSDHTFIDQDVTNGAAPVLDATNMTNLPTGNATHTGEVTGDTALTIASDIIAIDNLETKFKGTSAIASTEIDWDDEAFRTKTLGGNTVFTFASLYLGVKSLEITGNFTLGFPANFKVISGTYDGTVANYIEIICNDTSTPAGWIVISQEA